MRWSRISEAAATSVTGISAGTFAALSAARGKRVFHPIGVGFSGTVSFYDAAGAPLQGTHGALLRFSRGAGLPQRLPDVLGLAIKIEDLGQDLLLATAGEDAVTRHLLIPSTGFFKRPYSTILPYEFAGRSIVFGARPDPQLKELSDQDMHDLAAQVAIGRVRFELTWGSAATSEVIPLGSLVVDRPYERSLVFNPYNCVPDLRPAGALNRLRLDSYKSSQQARPDAEGTT